MNFFNYTYLFLILLSFACSNKINQIAKPLDSAKYIYIKTTHTKANLRPRPEPENNFQQSELCYIPLDTILKLKVLENVKNNEQYLKLILNSDDANKFCKNKDTWYIYKNFYEELKTDTSKMANNTQTKDDITTVEDDTTTVEDDTTTVKDDTTTVKDDITTVEEDTTTVTDNTTTTITAKKTPTPTVKKDTITTAKKTPTTTAKKTPTPTVKKDPTTTAKKTPTPTVKKDPTTTAKKDPIIITKDKNKCQVTHAVRWDVKNISPILYEDSTKNLVKNIYADVWFVDVFIAVMKDLKAQLKIKGIIHWELLNCRNVAGTNSWSMHAYGLAIDIKSILMSDGTEANVEKHWNEGGKKEEILKKSDQIFKKYFDEKLNPNSNAAHRNHFHLGLYPKNRPKSYKFVNYPASLSLYEETVKPIFFMQIANGSSYHNGE